MFLYRFPLSQSGIAIDYICFTALSCRSVKQFRNVNCVPLCIPHLLHGGTFLLHAILEYISRMNCEVRLTRGGWAFEHDGRCARREC